MAVRSTEARVWFEPLQEADRYLPEGPQYTDTLGPAAVVWVNIQTAPDATTGELFVRMWDEQRTGAARLPGRLGFVAPTDRPGVVFVGCEKAVGLYDLKTGRWEPLAMIPDADPRTIINDGRVVPGGQAVVFGTKDTRFKDPIAHLYLFTLADRRVSVLADRQVCSNGKVFHADDNGLVLYDIDTPTKVVTRYRFDLAGRAVTNEGVAIDLRGESAFPDGMADCGDGTVVVAFYNPAVVPAGRAGRYRLGTGELVEEWATPGSPRVTCPLLVERGGGVKLLLTTATEGMPAADRARCPKAGCLFVAETTLTSAPRAEVVRLA